jgi:tetratricopeptide (TPR) repeat protein
MQSSRFKVQSSKLWFFIAVVCLVSSILATEDSDNARRVILKLSQWQVEEADRMAEALVAQGPGNPYFAFLRSLTLYEKGAYPDALEEAARSVKALPAVAGPIRSRLLANHAYLENACKVLSGFKQIEGKFFIFSYKNPKDSILAYELFRVMDSARAIVGRDLCYTPGDKIRIEVYPDRASFITVSTLTEDEVKRTGTIALCKFNRIMFISPRSVVRGYRWRRTLCHEYVHFVINRISRNTIPIWFHEGLAHFEEVRFTGEKAGELSLLEKDLIYRAVKNNTLVPFAKMHPSMAKLRDAEESGTAFAEVALAISYLFEKTGYAGICNILRQCALENDLDSLLRAAVKCTTDFETNLFGYIRSRNFGPVKGVSVLKKDFVEDNAPDESFMFRKYLRLSELLLEKNRVTAAVKELERADATGKRHSPWVLNQVGRLYENNGEPDKAMNSYNQSTGLFPEYCNGYFNRAKLKRRRGNKQGVLADLESTLYINPFHLPAREEIIEVLQELGKKRKMRAHKSILMYLSMAGKK